MELLRIVATFFVMFVHADFLSLGIPKGGENLVHSIFQIEIESLSIVSVNLFVLISGWFGIHCSLKRILSLVFQCLFLYYAVLVLFSFTGSLGGG